MEQTLDLLFDEPARRSSSVTRLVIVNAMWKLSGAPGDFLAQTDGSAGDTADGALTGVGYGGQLRVDVEQEIEHNLDDAAIDALCANRTVTMGTSPEDQSALPRAGGRWHSDREIRYATADNPIDRIESRAARR